MSKAYQQRITACVGKEYQAIAGEMFFGDIPDFYEILQVIGEFEHSFNKG